MKKILIISLFLLLISFAAFSADEPVTVDEKIIFNNDESVVIYGAASDNPSDFGILLCNDEDSTPTVENSVKYSAFGKNDNGEFGVKLTREKLVFDGVFSLRTYAIYGDITKYSEETVILDWKEHYERIPLLSLLSVSEGELYPEFDEKIFEYTVLLNDIYTDMPSIKAIASLAEDNVSIVMPENISGDAKIYVDSGFSKSEYSVKFRLKKEICLPASKLLLKNRNVTSPAISAASSVESVNIGSNIFAYFSFNKDKLPEKFNSVKAELISSDSGFDIYKVTEPDWESKEEGFFISEYMPQYEAVSLNGNILNEEKFKVKSDISIALGASSDETVSTDISFKLTYYEDVDMPVFTDDSSSAALASIDVSGANELYPAFSKDVNEYYAVYEKLPSELPVITCLPEFEKASYTVDFEGDMATITVSSADGLNKSYYTVICREYKTATMPLTQIAGKRSPYNLFNMPFPLTNSTPYYFYPGRVENFGYSDYTHFTALAFDSSEVTDENIKISSAELQFFATTNCANGMELAVRRILNTKWPGNSEQMNYFGVWNGFVACGLEGKLNDKTVISKGASYLNSRYYRYYSVPLNTVGFTTPESVNLSFEGVWAEDGNTSSYQIIYLWLGKNGLEQESGRGMYPEVDIKYFVK